MFASSGCSSFSVVRASAASSRRRRSSSSSSSSSSSLTFYYTNNRNQSKKTTATNFLLLRDTKRSLIVSKAIEVEDEDDNDAEVVEEEEEKSDDDSSALKESQFTSYFAQLMENSDNDVDVLAKFQTEVMALEKSVKDMEAQVQGEQDQKAAIQDQYLRSVADFQNFQKRTAKEKADLAPAVKSKMVEAMLPVLDNFDLTAKNVKGENEGEEKIIKGYQLLHKQLLETLEAEGLKVVPGEGEPFDPNVHEAIMREESEDVAEDHIMEEFRKGYLVGEKLVRASMVKVSSGKP
jgi:molecular chaperone GrpE